MTRYHKLILTFILAIVAVAVPQGLQAQESSSAYNWLNISSSSRIYGLGGMNISLVDDDIQTTDQNPALLGLSLIHI